MKYILSTLLVILALGAAAQVPKKDKPVFTSINTIGLLTGSSGDNLALQTINGFGYRQWNVGLGTGIDWYGARSIPLLLDVRRMFGVKVNRPFVYANGGPSFPWAKGPANETWYNKVAFNTGWCAEAGVGYRVALKNNNNFILSAGYSYKLVDYDQYNYYDVGFPTPTDPTTNYRYHYRRIAIRVGIQF